MNRRLLIAGGATIAWLMAHAVWWPATARPLDGQPPAAPALTRVGTLAVDMTNGAIYIVDSARSMIFRAGPAGSLQPFGGTGNSGFNGDGRRALESDLNRPAALAVDLRTGELIVADTNNYRVRAISPQTGVVRTIAGMGIAGVPARRVPYDTHTPDALTVGHFSGDDGPAERAELNLPNGVSADPYGLVFIADSGNHRVRMVNRGTSPVFAMGVAIGAGHIKTIAGTGVMGFSGDGGKAAQAQLAYPTSLHVDAAGNLLIVDTFNQRLRRIDRHSGLIHTIATSSLPTITPERAMLTWSASIISVALTASQDVIYADRSDRAVHRLSRGGDHTLVYAAKGREAEIGSVDVGPHGEIYIADFKHQRVLRVDDGTARFVVGQPARNAAVGSLASPQR